MRLTLSVPQALPAKTKALDQSLRRPLFAALGGALETELRKHFASRDAEPNKPRWKKTHFWARRIRRATALSSVTETSATVTIADPAMAARIKGATIVPVEAKMLAIPLVEEAYGVLPRAKTIPGIFLLKTKFGSYLAKSEHTKAKKGKGRDYAGFTLYWKLVNRVTVPADTNALPPNLDKKMQIAAVDFLRSRGFDAAHA